LQRCKAPGARNGLARARVAAARAAGGSASRRNTLASSPHRLMRGALKVALLFAAAVTFSAVMAVSADMLHRHFRTIGFALDLRGACQASRHRRAIGSGWRCRRFDWLLNKSYYLSDLSLDTVVTRRCRVYLCVICESTYAMVSEGTIGK